MVKWRLLCYATLYCQIYMNRGNDQTEGINLSVTSISQSSLSGRCWTGNVDYQMMHGHYMLCCPVLYYMVSALIFNTTLCFMIPCNILTICSTDSVSLTKANEKWYCCRGFCALSDTTLLVVDFSLWRVFFFFVAIFALRAAAWRETGTDKTVTWTHVEDKYTDKSQRKKTWVREKVKAILCLNKLMMTDGVPSVCLHVRVSVQEVACLCVFKCV